MVSVLLLNIQLIENLLILPIIKQYNFVSIRASGPV